MAAILNLMRVTRCLADNAGRREVATERIRISRGPALGGIWKNVRLFNPARNLFLGLHHSLAPFHQSASDGADLFQDFRSFARGSNDHHGTTGARSCPTQDGSYLTYFGSYPTQTGGHPTQKRVSV